jgi:hypothetical protein
MADIVVSGNLVAEPATIAPEAGKFGIAGQGIVLKEARTGYVALLDVLGFRGLITGTAGATWVADYLATVNWALDLSDVESVIFSDSIVLTKEGSDADSLHAICNACAMLISHLMDKNIPMRGAIAHGLFYRSPFGKSVFIAGSPIVDAYDYEKKQDWVGVMLARSALQAAHGIDWDAESIRNFSLVDAHKSMAAHMKWRAIVQRCAQIPVHSAQGQDFLDGYAIVPCLTTDVDQIANELRRVMKRLDYLKLTASTPEDQRKYVGATKWLNGLAQYWEGHAANYKSYTRP